MIWVQRIGQTVKFSIKVVADNSVFLHYEYVALCTVQCLLKECIIYVRLRCLLLLVCRWISAVHGKE